MRSPFQCLVHRGKTEAFLAEHGRGDAYREMAPEAGAYYDGLIEIDLSSVECMIALPFHPSNAMPIREFKERMPEIIKEVEEAGNKIKGNHGEPFSIQSHMRDGEFYVDQALVSGCSGGLFENIVAMADILKGYGIPGSGLNLGHQPGQPSGHGRSDGAGHCRRAGSQRRNAASVYLRPMLRCD